MNSELFNQLIQEFAVLGGLLLVGVLLRSKVKFLQNLFLPASVIGGLIGLLLGPVVMGDIAILRIPQSFLDDFALIPGIFIIPILAAVPLEGVSSGKQSSSKTNIIPMFLLSIACMYGMIAIGFGVNLVFSRLMPNLEIYEAFGLELTFGFTGGHGLAGLLGNIFQGLNLPYWKIAQGVAIASATVGIIGGIIIGMGLINIGARKKQTVNLTDPSAISPEIKKGYYSIEAQQASCKESTHSSSIDTLALHAAIIFAVSGLAFVVFSFLKAHVKILSAITPWVWAVVLMLIVNIILKKLKLSFLIDSKIKSKFSSFLTDFAIVAAIASMPIKAVLNYAVPMVVMFILGFLFVWFILFFIGKKVFKSFWFERAIVLFGQNTGVAITGILLLRICDPEMKTPVLTEFSLAFALTTLIGLGMLFPMMKLIGNTGAVFMITLGITLVSLLFSFVYARFARNGNA